MAMSKVLHRVNDYQDREPERRARYMQVAVQLAAAGATYREIDAATGLSVGTTGTWVSRYSEFGRDVAAAQAHFRQHLREQHRAIVTAWAAGLGSGSGSGQGSSGCVLSLPEAKR